MAAISRDEARAVVEGERRCGDRGRCLQGREDQGFGRPAQETRKGGSSPTPLHIGKL